MLLIENKISPLEVALRATVQEMRLQRRTSTPVNRVARIGF